jgi:hypothetical protein
MKHQQTVNKFAALVAKQSKQSTCACCKRTLTAFSSLKIVQGTFVCAKPCVAR